MSSLKIYHPMLLRTFVSSLHYEMGLVLDQEIGELKNELTKKQSKLNAFVTNLKDPQLATEKSGTYISKFKSFFDNIKTLPSQKGSKELQNALKEIPPQWAINEALLGAIKKVEEKIKKAQDIEGVGKYQNVFQKFISSSEDSGAMLSSDDRQLLEDFYFGNALEENGDEEKKKGIKRDFLTIRIKDTDGQKEINEKLISDSNLIHDIIKDEKKEYEKFLVEKLDLTRLMIPRKDYVASQYTINEINFILYACSVKNPNLKEVYLGYNDIDESKMRVICSALIKDNVDLKLEKLILNGNKLGHGDCLDVIIKSLGNKNDNIICLGLSDNKIYLPDDNDKLINILSKLPNITELDISHNPRVINNLSIWIKEKSPKLTTLSIANTDFKENFDNLLTEDNLTKLKELKTLNLSHNKISELDATKKSALKKLVLSENITNLDLSNNDLGTYDSAIYFTSEEDSKKEDNKISLQKIFEKEEDKSRILKYKRLNLSNNNIGDDDLEKIFDSVKENTSDNSSSHDQKEIILEELNLFGNPIGDRSVDLLVKVTKIISLSLKTKVNKKLEILHKQLGPLTAEKDIIEEEQEIEKEKNKKITINITKCAITDNGKRKLFLMLREFENIKILGMENQGKEVENTSSISKELGSNDKSSSHSPSSITSSSKAYSLTTKKFQQHL